MQWVKVTCFDLKHVNVDLQGDRRAISRTDSNHWQGTDYDVVVTRFRALFASHRVRFSPWPA